VKGKRRIDLYERASELRSKGLTYRAIAKRIGAGFFGTSNALSITSGRATFQ
jgi:hypothetical protein